MFLSHLFIVLFIVCFDLLKMANVFWIRGREIDTGNRIGFVLCLKIGVVAGIRWTKRLISGPNKKDLDSKYWEQKYWTQKIKINYFIPKMFYAGFLTRF